MQLYYYKDPVGNFGDDLNGWLWPRLLPRPIESCFDADTLWVGIGTLLNQKIPPTPTKKIVFGTGCGYGPLPTVTDAWRFGCVRGPISAQLLGLPASAAICDGAVLVRRYFEPAGASRHTASFMPHHLTAKYDDWAAVCDDLSLHYIDPAAPVEPTIEAIRTSALVVTESLHGAIIADVLRVPWIAVRTRSRILDMKWRDWATSLRLDHRFDWLTPAWRRDIDRGWKRSLRPVAFAAARARLRWLLRHGERRLSQDAVCADVLARIDGAFDALACDAGR